MKKLHVLLIVILTVIVTGVSVNAWNHRDNRADLNHNGVVDAQDLSILLSNYTK